jgi:hypothetical protein
MKNGLIILILTFAVSCIQTDKVPDYVIPKEDMVNIIRDIHLTDGMLTVSDVRRDLARQDTVNYYNAIFETYGYNRAEFDTSIYYYSKEINTFDEIYKEVLNQLNEMETLLKEEDSKEEEQNEPKTDVGNS